MKEKKWLLSFIFILLALVLTMDIIDLLTLLQRRTFFSCAMFHLEESFLN